jgi:predicted outer membrane repeat protein
VLILSNSTIDSNFAMESESVGLLLEPTEVLFSNVKFTRNGFLTALDFPDSASKDNKNYTAEIAISIQKTGGKVNFSECEFVDNTAKRTTAYLYLNKATNVTIERTRFENRLVKYSKDSAQGLQGGFLHVVADSKVYIRDSTFLKGYAEEGGALYTLGSTSIFLYNSRFEGNQAANRQGGAISAISFT